MWLDKELWCVPHALLSGTSKGSSRPWWLKCKEPRFELVWLGREAILKQQQQQQKTTWETEQTFRKLPCTLGFYGYTGYMGWYEYVRDSSAAAKPWIKTANTHLDLACLVLAWPSPLCPLSFSSVAQPSSAFMCHVKFLLEGSNFLLYLFFLSFFLLKCW